MDFHWFFFKQAHGGTRYELFKMGRNEGAWSKTPYFIDAAPNSAHFTQGEKYGLYGSGMGQSVNAPVPYRIAACFGGYRRLSDAKKLAEQKVLGE